MADNSKTKERLKEITDSIETGIKELFESDKYMQYLRTMSRFHSYSLNNTVLISMQKPDATLVAGFNKWRDQFSRNVKKGERSIKIIAPTPYKIKKEQEKVDPVTKAPMLDADGKVQTEEVEVKIPMYKVVSVFDVSQTEGKPLPTLSENLTGDVRHFNIFMEALKRAVPVPIFFEKMPEDTDGYFHTTKQYIAIREEMSEIQTVSAVIHEIAHSKLHNYEKGKQEQAQSDENTEPIKPKSRQTEEVEAESISFAVCSYYGIKTNENSLGYIATWSKGKELPELRSSLETINKTASELIGDIDRHFAEIVKEQGIYLSAEKETIPYYLTAEQVKEVVTAYGAEGKLVSGEQELLMQNVGTLANTINNHLIMWQSDHLGESIPADVEQNMVKERIASLVRELAPDELAYQMGDFYFSIQTVDDGYDYSIYDKDYNLLDGGVYDDPDISIFKAMDSILDDEPAMDFSIAQTVDYEELTEKADEAWQESVAVKKAEILPDEPIQEHAYPLPDPDISISDRNNYGYLYDGMLPLTKERAIELFEQDLTVYLLYEDNTEAMAFDREEIKNHDGIFGIENADWTALQEFEEMKTSEKFPMAESEQQFLENPVDAYAVYQLKEGGDLRDYRFERLERLQEKGLSVSHDNYNFIYTAPLHGFPGSQGQILEKLNEQFNLDHPDDFTGHSLSVSDIIALNQGGAVTYHYCDSSGFTEVPQFFNPAPLVPDQHLTGDKIDTPRGSFFLTSMTKEQMAAAGYGIHHTSADGNYHIMGNGTRAYAIKNEDNPLRTAEMSTEQNYNQIDGIINNQPTVAELEHTVKEGGQISLLDLAHAVKEEKKEKRISVVEQLKNQSAVNKEKQKTAPYTGAEMER